MLIVYFNVRPPPMSPRPLDELGLFYIVGLTRGNLLAYFNIENVLIVTDHFTRYAQAFPSKTQTALATAKLLWNNFIIHYGFPNKIISDQGCNFESELIANLCEVAGVQKLKTSPYHPQTNGQCERFNSTLLNMLGTLTPEHKNDWKTYVPAMVHAYNCTRNTATGYSPYYLLFGREPRLPIDVEFGLKRGNQQVPPSKSNYVTQLRRRLRFAHKKAKQVASKQQARHKGLYDRRCKGGCTGHRRSSPSQENCLEGQT